MQFDQRFRLSSSAASSAVIRSHLEACDSFFVPNLSSYVDIQSYARKLYSLSKTIEVWHKKDLVALLCYYDENSGPIFISNLSVLPEFSGLRIATGLIQILKAIAAESNSPSIELSVYRQNLNAIHLYLANDFHETGGTKEVAHFTFVF